MPLRPRNADSNTFTDRENAGRGPPPGARLAPTQDHRPGRWGPAPATTSCGRRGLHRQGHGRAEPASKTWRVNTSWGHRGKHRRRPRRLDPSPRPLRRRGPAGRLPRTRSGTGSGASCPALRPRPPAGPQDQPRLALETRLHHLLPTALRPASPCLTSSRHQGRRTTSARLEPVHTRAPRGVSDR
jgi:hypothetical protein